ncbi:DUF6550 family protein [Faecalispora sporosphaeroides]|uniref:DUF6550 family protein n=1 Tax=Faecalispora sporosphaeroides TaxID=1549 RepID=UPI00035DDA8F|nr:DUF6550 family protein [Faecalispora sporosphaeroides]
MKKKYIIAIAAVIVFAGVATAFATQDGGKDDPLTPAESTTSSNVSLTIGEINSADVAGGAAGSTSGSGSGAASAGDKNTTALTSIAPKSSSMPPAPVIEGAGSETSSGYTKATNPALTDPDKQPTYKETPVIDNGKKTTSSSSSSSKSNSSSSSKSSSSKSSSSKSSSSTPKAGDVKDGKTYMPGFGWVDGTGGGEGETVGKSGDELTGEKVGIME